MVLDRIMFGVATGIGVIAALVVGWSLGAGITYGRSFGSESIELIEIAVVVLAVVMSSILVASGWRSWHGGRRSAGIALVAATYMGASFAGVALGPTYVPPIETRGTLTLRLTAPVRGEDAAAATCQSVPNGTDFKLVSSIGLEIAGQPLTVDMSTDGQVTYGGMGIPSRADRLGLLVTFVAAGDPGPYWEARPETELEVLGERTAWSGSMRFSGLGQTVGSGGFGLRDPLVLEGEVRWDCQPPTP